MDMTFEQVESEFEKAITLYCKTMKVDRQQVLSSPEHLAFVARSIILVNSIGMKRAKQVATPGTGRSTQARAFQAVDGKRLTQRERILNLLVDHPGLTREEVAQSLRMRTQSCTARVCELLQSGDLLESGTKTGSSGLEQARLFVRE